MLKRKYLITAFLTLCITATLFIGVTTSGTNYNATITNEYDPWVDIDGDGAVDADDVCTCMAPARAATPYRFCIYVDVTTFSGHAFVQLENTLTGYKPIRGHYPHKDRGWLETREGKGEIRDDWERNWNYKICRNVTWETFEKLDEFLTVKTQPENALPWSLYSINCMRWAAMMAAYGLGSPWYDTLCKDSDFGPGTGICDPYALCGKLMEIGDGGNYGGFTVIENTGGVPAHQDPPAGSVSLLILGGLENASDLASFFSVPLVEGSLNLLNNLTVGETLTIESPIYNDLNNTLAYWDFGDGAWDFNTTTTSHAYSAPGTYPVVFLLENNTGIWRYEDVIIVTSPVGGIYIPVNKLELLAPYIGLTILLAVVVVTVGYVKKRKKQRLTLRLDN